MQSVINVFDLTKLRIKSSLPVLQ